ncbi:TrmH family RNA methyltransferase [Pelosinus propionicus]|uniref:RNA methyltransferase, TrmH family n=2 Tax=Pelosinus TaxID=365348 RepID=A0A1I4P6F8_9FIRM|nr:RNA methyltransferase, TrmH family [Pelosinus propionicus DSM 13327]
MEIITSSQNRFIKMVASLKEKKFRDELGLFSIEGVRLVEEAAQANWPVEACIYITGAEEDQRVQAMLVLLQSKNCRIIEVSAAIYGKITEVKQPQGIMAIMKKRENRLVDCLINVQKPLLVVLDEVQDPGNVGTIIRTAAAAGCTGVILTKGCADVFGAKAVRATMGSLFYIPIFEGFSHDEVVNYLNKYDIHILATSLENSTTYFRTDFNRSVAIVFGNEGNGVSKKLTEVAKERLHIPLLGNVESLNVAASAAVILYEAVRQRQ